MTDGTVVAPTRMRGYAVAFGLIALTAALAALHLVALGGQPAFRLDDAYIVLNNAAALLETDQAFPDAPPLLGSTSLAHTFLVAGLSFVVPPETALLFLGWAGLLLFSLGVARFAGLEGAPDWLQLLFGLAALLCGDLFRVHLNGLETSLVLAAIIWTVIGTTERWSPVPFGAFLGVLPFLRPELAVLGAMCFIVWAVGQRHWRVRLTGFAVGLIVFAALLSVQAVLSGGVLPRTGDAKTIFFDGAPGILTGLIPTIHQQTTWFFLVVAGVLSFAMVAPNYKRPVSLVVTAFGLAVLTLLVVKYPSFMGQNHYRYLYILFPVALINAAVWCGSGPRARTIVVALLAASLAQSGWSLARDWSERADEVADKRGTLAATAAWVEARMRPGETMLVHDIGYVSYALDRQLFDIVGLRSSRAIEVNEGLLGRPPQERRGLALDQFARDTGACYLLVTQGWNRWLGLTSGMEAQGWRLIVHPDGHPPAHEAYLIDRPGCAFR